MKNTQSSGVDTITMKTLKMFQETLEPALLNIVNTLILTNTFPNSLKISKVLPHLKPGKNEMNPESYRPINILNTIAKIVETVVSCQLKEFLKANKLIPAQHNGGLPGKSTVTTVLTLIDIWSNIIEDKEETVCIQLDLT